MYSLFWVATMYVAKKQLFYYWKRERETRCKKQSAASILHTQWARCLVLSQEKQDAVRSSHQMHII